MLFIAKIKKYISVEKAIAMKNNQSCSLYDDTPDLHKKDRRIIKPRYEIENMKIALKNCKPSIKNELSKGMFKIIGKFKKEEQTWLKSINEPKIKNEINNLKQKLEII